LPATENRVIDTFNQMQAAGLHVSPALVEQVALPADE
jgi:hypothetical protein